MSKRFPIMDGPSIPWEMLAPFERRAMGNHDQTLGRLAERGGLSCEEVMAVLLDQRWKDRTFRGKDAEYALVARLKGWDDLMLRKKCKELEKQLAETQDKAAKQGQQFYWMLIRNCARFLRTKQEKRDQGEDVPEGMDIFVVSTVLSIALAKRLEDVTDDLAHVELA